MLEFIRRFITIYINFLVFYCYYCSGCVFAILFPLFILSGNESTPPSRNQSKLVKECHKPSAIFLHKYFFQMKFSAVQTIFAGGRHIKRVAIELLPLPSETDPVTTENCFVYTDHNKTKRRVVVRGRVGIRPTTRVLQKYQ